MAADLHIHVIDGCTEDEVKIFSSSILGSKYFSWGNQKRDYRRVINGKEEDLYSIIGNTPNLWICEVSWLKASFAENPDEYVPSVASSVSSIIGEDFPILNDEMVAKLLNAMQLENTTTYSNNDESRKIIEFLMKHKGKKLFTVSW